MGCLAAQVVAHFKDGAGGIYLYPPKERNLGQEYEYHISIFDDKLYIEVFEVDLEGRGRKIYSGVISKNFKAWCEEN